MRPEGFEFRKFFQPWLIAMQLLTLSWSTIQNLATSYEAASLYTERINTGYGLEGAVLGIAIWNSEQTARNVTWLEEWPAWIKVYMHTLRVTVNNEVVSNGELQRKLTRARIDD